MCVQHAGVLCQDRLEESDLWGIFFLSLFFGLELNSHVMMQWQSWRPNKDCRGLILGLAAPVPD